MYTTLYNVTVHPIQVDPVEFVDSNDTPGAGSAVLAQLTANKDVDSAIVADDIIDHVIIPLHAVDYAEVTEQRTEGEYEDDNNKNCTDGGDSGETGTLVINLPDGDGHITLRTTGELVGTYSGYTFTYDEDDDESSTVINYSQDVRTVSIDGLPTGRSFFVNTGGATVSATVPGTMTIDDGGSH